MSEFAGFGRERTLCIVDNTEFSGALKKNVGGKVVKLALLNYHHLLTFQSSYS